MIVEDFLRYMLAEREASPRTVSTYREALDDYVAFLRTLRSKVALQIRIETWYHSEGSGTQRQRTQEREDTPSLFERVRS